MARLLNNIWLVFVFMFFVWGTVKLKGLAVLFLYEIPIHEYGTETNFCIFGIPQ